MHNNVNSTISRHGLAGECQEILLSRSCGNESPQAAHVQAAGN